MKKIHFIAILILIVFLCCGCGANDETKIEKAMKEYAKANFSNPKDYKGIVSMSIVDTIDYALLSKKSVEDKTRFDSICKAKMESIFRVNNRSREIRENVTSWYYGVLIDRAKEELANSIVAISVAELLSPDSIYCVKIDSLLQNYTFDPLRHYNIKVKTVQLGELEYVIKDYSAYVSDGSGALITGSPNIDIYNLQNFHMRNEDEWRMLMDYTTAMLKARTEKLNAIQEGEKAAEEVSSLCVEYLYDY